MQLTQVIALLVLGRTWAIATPLDPFTLPLRNASFSTPYNVPIGNGSIDFLGASTVVDNCEGSYYCGHGAQNVAQNAINSWESFVFYLPGTSMVASHGGYHRTTIFSCPEGYQGPGVIGIKIKEGLQQILTSCHSDSCGRYEYIG